MAIQIEFKPVVLEQLQTLYPRTKNWDQKLKQYEELLNSELLINENLRQTDDRLFDTYLVSSDRLNHFGGRFSEKNIYVHKVMRDEIKIFKIIDQGSNLTKQLTTIFLDKTMMTITDQTATIIDTILDSNDEEIDTRKWERELADEDAVKTLYRLFPDAKSNPELYEGHELEVNLDSLKNYIVWLKTSASKNDKNSKRLLQATTILQVATLLSADGITGYWLQKPVKSAFGRTYYTGMNIQNVNKELRRAILGESVQYDMRSCAATWKFSYAKAWLNQHGSTATPDRAFEITRQYIGSKGEREYLFKQIAKDVFPETLTRREKDQLLKEAGDDSKLYNLIKFEYLTQEEQIKALKRAFTAIQFGAKLTGNHMWPDDNKESGFAKTGIAEAMLCKNNTNRFIENKIVKQFVKEQTLLEEFIISTETKNTPELLDLTAIKNNFGKVQNNKLMAFLFQHYETAIMDEVREIIKLYEYDGVKILANIHDAIIVNKPLKELGFIVDELRKKFNNQMITLVGEKLEGYRKIPTNQTEINDHKQFIFKSELLSKGYKPMACDILPRDTVPSLEDMMNQLFDFQEEF